MEELIRKFGIDWKLLVAQIVNFIILLFLMRKFLYKPLIDLMNKRREKIMEGLEKAKKGEEEFKKIEEIKTRELAKIQKEGEAMIVKAKEIGEKKQEEILVEAENKTKKIIEEAKLKIDIDKEKMLKEVHQDIAKLVVGATEKILKEKVDEKKEKDLFDKVFNELKQHEV